MHHELESIPHNIVAASSGSGTVTRPVAVHRQLQVGRQDDEFEREADAAAERVTRMPDQRPDATTGTFVQLKAAGSQDVPKDVSNSIQNLQGQGRSLDGQTQSFMSSRFAKDFSDVRIHADTQATHLNEALNAKAFTVGNDIYFNQGQYQPQSDNGRRLIAHELTHTIQQHNAASMVQKETTDVINMPPLTITAGMPDTSLLSTPVAPGAMTAGYPAATIDANSQLPETVLPFTPAGWDGNDIANKLGQYDRIPGTDSDAVRCVQAVALVSHVLNGPGAAIDYLSAIALQGILQRPILGAREQAARKMIDFVKLRIANRDATYGHMYWAMEAVHDLFYADDKGTPAAGPDTVRGQISPPMDAAQKMFNMDVWCANKAELLAQASALNAGEQLMVNLWTINFNATFDLAGFPQTQNSGTYRQTDENGRNGKNIFIRRIDTTQKPASNKIDTNRDGKAGHQMLIFKDPANQHIKMYEPEITLSGSHLFDLTTDALAIDTSVFHDQPAFELYNYVQIWGKISPAPAAFPSSP